jgi:hypothetical protein
MNDSFDNSPQKKLGTGPKTRVCYVCGRQYGLHSFEIHLKQCKELWIAREAEKDPRDRKKLPEDPMLKLGVGGDSEDGGSPMPTAKQLEEINKLSSAAFNTEALDTCAFCGRTFLPEKLLIHNRSCTAENPARKITDNVKRGGGAANTPMVTPTKSESTSTPVRPTSSSRPRTNPNPVSRSSADMSEQDGVTNLRIEDGNLVGHLGGPSGRPWRQNKSPATTGIASPQPTNNSRPTSTTLTAGNDVFNISDFRDKEEVVEYLLQKLDGLGNIATDLARSIIEIRSVVEQLR